MMVKGVKSVNSQRRVRVIELFQVTSPDGSGGSHRSQKTFPSGMAEMAQCHGDSRVGDRGHRWHENLTQPVEGLLTQTGSASRLQLPVIQSPSYFPRVPLLLHLLTSLHTASSPITGDSGLTQLKAHPNSEQETDGKSLSSVHRAR